MFRLFLLAAALMAFAQEQPSADERRDIIAQMRERALKFNQSLPDFICTQKTRRSVDYSGSGDRWELLDTIEQQLTYFDRRENYKLIAVNGRPPNARNQMKTGVTSGGEFGSMLGQLFDRSVGAAFQFERWDTLRGRPVAVFSYRVDQSRSRATIGVASMVVVTGYHGLVYADRETKLVVRLVLDAEPPQSFPMQDISHVLDYGLVPVAGGEFTLPLHSEMRARVHESLMNGGLKRLFGRDVRTLNEVDFLLYRKYGAEAAISFESQEKGKE